MAIGKKNNKNELQSKNHKEGNQTSHSEGSSENGEISKDGGEEYHRISESDKLYATGDKNAKKSSSSKDEKTSTVESTTEKDGNSSIILKTIQPIKSDTDLLWDEICNGVNGKNSGIPMGFDRLNKYIGLRKSIYTLIGAGTGVGKTALVDCAYVLNPYDWYINNRYNSKVKFKTIYFSMERKKTYKLAKWLCMKIFRERGVLLTTEELLSWTGKLDKRKQELAEEFMPYFEEMLDSGIVQIIDGAINPTGIYKHCIADALRNGREEDKNQYEKIYIPNDDNLIINVVQDHIGCLKRENISGSYDKKTNIDKLSEYNRIIRDMYHYSPVAISQFNRTGYADIQQAKKDGIEPEPTLEYFKDSGATQEDADVILTLFNPLRYNIEDYMGYEINKFKNENNGNFHFRSLKILKNSYGTSDVRIGMGFLGEIGQFKEVPKAKDISDYDYEEVVNHNFFRK